MGGNRELQAECDYLCRVTEIQGEMIRMLAGALDWGEGDGAERLKFEECVAELKALREVRPILMTGMGF